MPRAAAVPVLAASTLELGSPRPRSRVVPLLLLLLLVVVSLLVSLLVWYQQAR